jgi:hypothetical protein
MSWQGERRFGSGEQTGILYGWLKAIDCSAQELSRNSHKSRTIQNCLLLGGNHGKSSSRNAQSQPLAAT